MPGEKAQQFAQTILDAHEQIRRCKICKNFTDSEICSVCADESRDHSVICVVEDPRDVFALERTGEFHEQVKFCLVLRKQIAGKRIFTIFGKKRVYSIHHGFVRRHKLLKFGYAFLILLIEAGGKVILKINRQVLLAIRAFLSRFILIGLMALTEPARGVQRMVSGSERPSLSPA